LAALGDRLTSVDLNGETFHVLGEDLDDLRATLPTKAVRLLPGYDPWVMGPGTDDSHVVPPARRALISRQAPFVIAGGLVSGTWALTDDEVSISWFPESGRPPQRALADEVDRLATVIGRPLRLDLRSAT
jgi:hypothetical protein